MVLNLAIVFLYVINVLLRMGTHVPGIGTILLSGVGLLLLGVSGWLGGELVYARGVGVDREGRGRGKKNSTAA